MTAAMYAKVAGEWEQVFPERPVPPVPTGLTVKKSGTGILAYWDQMEWETGVIASYLLDVNGTEYPVLPTDLIDFGSLTNLVPNPSLEADLTGWTVGAAGGTLSRITTDAFSGSACINHDSIATNASANITVPVTAGKTYSFSIYTKATTVAGAETLSIQPQTSAAASVGTAFVSAVTTIPVGGGWVRVKMENVLIPATATQVRFRLIPGAIGVFKHDGAMVSETATAQDYKDGSSSGWEWSGTPNNSASSGPIYQKPGKQIDGLPAATYTSKALSVSDLGKRSAWCAPVVINTNLPDISDENIPLNGLVFHSDPANPVSLPVGGSTITDMIGASTGAITPPVTIGDSPLPVITIPAGSTIGVPFSIKAAWQIQCPMTVVGWVRVDASSPDGKAIVLSSDYQSHQGVQFASNEVKFGTGGVLDSTARRTFSYNVVPQLADYEWHMMAFTARSTSDATVYFDAVAISVTASGTGGGSIQYGSSPLNVGNTQNNGGASRMVGDIGPIMIYNRSLSLAEIQQIFAEQSPRFVSP